MIDDNYDDDDGFVSDFNGDGGFSMPLDDDEDDND